jgi:acyl-CoA thioesterase
MGLLETGLDFPYVPGLTPGFTRGFEYRWDPSVLPFSGASEARVDGAVRIRGAERVDAKGVLALLDAWPAPVLALASGPILASTVTWQVNLACAVPERGWSGDGFWRYRSESQSCSQGYADMDSQLWAPDGTLVASGRQLVAEFSAR